SLHRTDVGAKDSVPAEDCSIVFVETEAATTPPAPPDLPDPNPPPVPNETPIFIDETPTPRVSKPTSQAPLRRPPSAQTQPARAGRVLALFAPRPEYPYEARRSRLTGDGTVRLTIDPRSGRVLDVFMTSSTGSALLDQAALAGFRRWRFRPGSPSTIQCPITYTLTGAAL
ncbi:MAG: energy transducer TonB, partial [Chthoniobacterales bacterium]